MVVSPLLCRHGVGKLTDAARLMVGWDLELDTEIKSINISSYSGVAEGIQGLKKCRTHDKVSGEVFASAGAKAASISFADTMPKLAEGSINAVLSSGDGGSGRKLWEFLPYFSEITYSLPLSVASVNQAIYDGLTPDLRDAVDTASRQTEIELWLALSTRLQENYQRMRQNGVTIDSSPAPAVVAALQSGAAAAQQAWCTRSGSTCAKVLEAFKTGKP